MNLTAFLFLDNDLTIKRLNKFDGQLASITENPNFQAFLTEEGDELPIWDVVTNCLRSFRRGGR